MSKITTLEPRFLKSIPRELEDGVLYISMEFATAVHQCACGCESKVVTPFSPTDWNMNFDGRTISIHPSIGNWSLPCRSHYFIKRGKISWAGDCSDEEVIRIRIQDRKRKAPEQKSFHSQIGDEQQISKNLLGKISRWLGF